MSDYSGKNTSLLSEKIKINYSDILEELYEKYKNENWILSVEEIKKIQNSWFPGIWKGIYISNISPKIQFGLKSGVFFGSLGIETNDGSWETNHDITIKMLNDHIQLKNNSVHIKVSYYKNVRWSILELSKSEFNFFQLFIDKIHSKIKERQEREKDERKQTKSIEDKRLFKVKEEKKLLLKELDKDDNGDVDFIEGDDDFMILFKKHQKKIIEIDRNYIQKFVKISNYLNSKRSNIKNIFNELKDYQPESELVGLLSKEERRERLKKQGFSHLESFKMVKSDEDLVDPLSVENFSNILKNNINTYESLLLHSITMIISLVEEDLITFYEIYEMFDKLNVFNSNWENEVSQKLTDIGDGLVDLMYSIQKMEVKITNELNNLSYITQESFSMLNKNVTEELKSIDSSIKFNNLLTGISTYQLYKINKQTKGLLKG